VLDLLNPIASRRQFAGGCLAASAAAIPPGSSAAALPPIDQRLAQVDAIAAAMMKEAGYPGLVIGIEQGGQVYPRAYGMADAEQGIRMSAEAVLPIGSVTKSFTGLSIAQLVAAGKVDLARPVGSYLAGYKGPGAAVAIRHLLNHTSGIRNYTSDPDFPRDIGQHFTHDAVIATIAAKQLEFAPGTHFSYSNTNTYLLGMVIEQVSGMPYAAYIDANIFKPFGMVDSRFAGSTQVVPHRVPGYAMGADGLENAQQYDVNYPFSAGAIVSTVTDLLRYRRGVFGGATAAGVRKQLLTCDPLSDGSPLFYALGCLAVREFEGRRRISHAGDIEGFASHYAYFPRGDLTIAVLTNLGHAPIAPYAISRKVARAMLGIVQPRILDLPVPPAIARAIAGDYDVRPIQFGVARYGFTVKDGVAAMHFGGAAASGGIPLAYQGGGMFVTRFDTEFSFEFAPGGKSLAAEFYDGRFTAFKAG
jgi:D-alanyl-D-alanine carboxypeptidase